MYTNSGGNDEEYYSGDFEDEEMPATERELAEDAQWKVIQKNTFTRWTNEHLKNANKGIADLEHDLADGLRLCALIEVLSGKKFKRINKRPNFRSQKLENVTTALTFLEEDEGIKIVNIDSTDIVDSKLKLILGLIWTLILHYSISMPMWEGEEDMPAANAREGPTPKQRLLIWVQNKLPDLPVKNFTTDWNDGRAIGALVDAVGPGLCPDWDGWNPNEGKRNAKEAMDLAEEWLDVPQLIRPEEMVNPKVDELSMMTYLSQFPNAKLKAGAPLRPRTNPARVRAYGPGLEPEGLCSAAPARFTVETFSAGRGDVKVAITNPDGDQEQCDVVFNNDRNLTYSCQYVPSMEGDYTVQISFAGKEIPKSPYKVLVEGAAGDADKVTAAGPGLESSGVQCGKKTYFEVFTEGAGIGNVEIVIVDPHGRKDSSKPRITKSSDTTYYVEYIAKEIGRYSVHIYFAGKEIPFSPYSVNIGAAVEPKRAYATGRGIQAKGVRVEDIADIKVHTENAGQADVKGSLVGPTADEGDYESEVKGREEPLRFKQIDANTYETTYTPTQPGNYTVNLLYGGSHIAKSPFKVKVLPYKESKIRAYGPGLEGGVANKKASFVVETNGETGALGFSIEGPSQAKIDCKDGGDGSADVTYVPTVPGEYAVHVLCDNEDIHGSPFMAQIAPALANANPDMIVPENALSAQFAPNGVEEDLVSPDQAQRAHSKLPGFSESYDPDLVIAEGPGLQPKGVAQGKPAPFTVDTRRAGNAPLKVYGEDLSGQPIKVDVRDNKDGTYSCSYTPKAPIKHTIFITFGGVNVLNSPFRVYVEEPSMPEKVKVFGPGIEKGVTCFTPTHFFVDCTDAGPGDVAISLTDDKGLDVPVDADDNGEGLFRIQYEPQSVGTYTANVIFADQEIPTSPFKIKIEPNVDVSGIQVLRMEPSFTVNKVTSFKVKSASKTQKPRVTVLVTSPSKKVFPATVRDNFDGANVSFTPKEVGQYALEVYSQGVLIGSSPYRIESVDPTGKIQPVPLEEAITPEKNKPKQNAPPISKQKPWEKKPGSKPGEKSPNDDSQPSESGTPAWAAKKLKPFEKPKKPIEQQSETPDEKTPASKVVVYGDGLKRGVVNTPATFVIDTSQVGQGDLQYNVDGPSKAQVTSRIIGENKTEVTYIVPFDGTYIIMVTFNKSKVSGAPFRAQIEADESLTHLKPWQRKNVQSANETAETKLKPWQKKKSDGEPDDKDKDQPEYRVKVYGDGITHGKPNHPNKFIVDTSAAGAGKLGFSVRGPGKAPLTPKDIGNNKVEVTYTPTLPGPYIIDITYGDKPVKDSPFNASITPTGVKPETVPASKEQPSKATLVKVYGDGISHGRPKQPNKFIVDTSESGPGKLGFNIKGPGSAPLQPKDIGHNRVEVSYTPSLPGDYIIDVLYDDQPVKDSPFIASITPTGLKKKPGEQSPQDDQAKLKPHQRGKEPEPEADLMPHLKPLQKKAVDKKNAHNLVRVYGEGISHGKPNQFNKFTVDTSEAGDGDVTFNIDGPGSAPLTTQKISKHRCDVTYKPSQPGDYTIDVMYNASSVKDSPFVASITPSGTKLDKDRASLVKVYGDGISFGKPNQSNKFFVDTTESGPGNLKFDVKGPGMAPVSPKEIAPNKVEVSYTPNLPGIYNIEVAYDNTPVKGSPYSANITSTGKPQDTKPESMVKVYGDGITHGKPKQPAKFIVDTSESGPGKLDFNIKGPGDAPLQPKDIGNNRCEVTYTPTLPGDYIIDVSYNQNSVKGSPFKASITPSGARPSEISQAKTVSSKIELVKVYGDGIVRGRPFQPAKFIVDTSESGPGKLDFKINGPTAPRMVPKDIGNGKCEVSYTPSKVGEYKIDVMYNGKPVESSPFTATITPAGDKPVSQSPVEPKEIKPMENSPVQSDQSPDKPSISKVKVFGDGITHGRPFQPAKFIVDTSESGPGKLDFKINGPTAPRMVPKDIGNGKCEVSYTPSKVGEYKIDVMYNGEPVKSSPFTATITPTGKKPVSQSPVEPKEIKPMESSPIQSEQSPDKPSISKVKVFGDGITHGRPFQPAKFIVDSSESGPGKLDFKINGPTAPRMVPKDIGNGKCEVSYTPSKVGEYKIDVMYNGEPVKSSPFTATITPTGKKPVSQSPVEPKEIKPMENSPVQSDQSPDKPSISKVKVFGDGITHGRPFQPAKFIVDSSESGPGKLDFKINGPTAPRMVPKDLGNGKCEVSYTPSKVGEYKIDVMYNGEPVESSPFTATITPTGKKPVLQSPVEPKEIRPMENSPVQSEQSPGKPSFSKVKVYGDGVSHGRPFEPAKFTVDTTESGPGKLGFNINGPAAAKLVTKDTGNGKCEVTYTPSKVGEYIIDVTYENEPIPQSPFKASITPTGKEPAQSVSSTQEDNSTIKSPTLASKVKITGDGISHGCPFQPAKFIVDTSESGPGKLDFDINGPVATKLVPKDIGNGKCEVSYTPSKVGEYTIDVRYDGKSVPSAPFTASISPTGQKPIAPAHELEKIEEPVESAPSPSTSNVCDVSKVVVEGDGISHGKPFQPSKFVVDTSASGPGELGFNIAGPGAAKLIPKDIGNGKCEVSYTPSEIGGYEIEVTYDGQPVPNSPFKALITSTRIKTQEKELEKPKDQIAEKPKTPLDIAKPSPAEKVQVTGEGITTGQVFQPTRFIVDTSESGPGKLGFNITGPVATKLIPEDIGNGKCEVCYTPTKPGNYQIDLTYDGLPLSKSPFTVSVIEPPELVHPESITPVQNQPDAVKVSGPALNGSSVNQPTAIIIDTSEAGPGSLGFGITGPGAALLKPKDIGNGKCELTFTPKVPGDYAVEVSYKGKPVTGSPFNINVVPDQKPHTDIKQRSSKVKVLNTENLHCVPNLPTILVLDTNESGPGALAFNMQGPEQPVVTATDIGNNQCEVCYTVVAEGEYFLDITLDGQPIRKEPLKVICTKAASPSQSAETFPTDSVCFDDIEVFETTTVNTTKSFTVDTKPYGDGDVGIDVQGPGKPVVNILELEDGLLQVEYCTANPGRYLFTITHNEKPIAGSPFCIVFEDEFGNVPTNTGKLYKIQFIHSIVEHSRLQQLSSNDRLRIDTHETSREAFQTTSTDSEFSFQLENLEPSFRTTTTTATETKQQILQSRPSSCVDNTSSVVQTSKGVPATLSGRQDESIDVMQAAFTLESQTLAGTSYPDTERGDTMTTVTSQHQDFTPDQSMVDRSEVTRTTTTTTTVTKYRDQPQGEQVVVPQDIVPNQTVSQQQLAPRSSIPTSTESSEFEENILKSFVDRGKQPRKTVASEPTKAFELRFEDFPVDDDVVDFSESTSVSIDHTVVDEGDIIQEEVQRVRTENVQEQPQLSAETISFKRDQLKMEAIEIVEIVKEPQPAPTGTAAEVEVEMANFEVTEINQISTFLLKPKPRHTGKIEFSVRGPGNAQLLPKDLGNGTCEVSFKPSEVGLYVIEIRSDGEHIPGSPFYTRVTTDRNLDVSKVAVQPTYETESISEVFRESTTDFTVDARSVTPNGEGKVRAIITNPSGTKHDTVVTNNEDGTYKVAYAPYEEGPHEIDVTYDGLPIPGTPFPVSVRDGNDPTKVKAYGPGLDGGLTNVPQEFTIETRGAGQGGLSLAVEGPSKAEVSCVDNHDGTCTVGYVPTKPGEYDITIKFADQHIPNSPFKVPVEDAIDPSKVKCYGPGLEPDCVRSSLPTQFTVDARDAGRAPLDVTMDDGTGRPEPVVLESVDEGVFTCTYKPKQEGPCQLNVNYAGEPVPGSPFTQEVLPTHDASKVNVSGPGIEDGCPASLPTYFDIDTTDAGVADLDIAIQAPDGMYLRPKITDNKDATVTVNYTPDEVGKYKAKVKYGGDPINGSPFEVNTRPTGDASRCQITDSKKRVVVDEECVITVDTADAGQGNLTCRIRTPSDTDADIDIVDNNDGTVSIFFTPHTPGNYGISIKFGGVPIPDGEYTMEALPEDQMMADEADLVAQQKVNGLHSGLPAVGAFHPVDFVIPVGPVFAMVSAEVETPSGRRQPVDILDNGDGTVTIKHQPTETGLHKMHVTYNEEPLEGSPYEFFVDAVDSGVVAAYGPGLSYGVSGEPCTFTIDTKNAGPGGLSVSIEGPRKPEIQIKDNGDRTFTVSFIPHISGHYKVTILSSGTPISGSPFNLTVQRGPGGLKLAVEGPSKAELVCQDNNDGTCTVTYLPTAPGLYSVVVTFDDEHILGSPFTSYIADSVTGEPKEKAQLSMGQASEFPLSVGEYDINTLTADITSPSGNKEHCRLKKLPNGHLGISFTPREIGTHMVNVYQDGQHIKNSPFKINVTRNEVGDASKVRVSGDGLTHGTANDVNEFFIDARDAGYGGLSLAIEGPSKADIDCKDNPDGTCDVSYKPTQPGTYIISIKFADQHVPGSPFTCKVDGVPQSKEEALLTSHQKAVDITHVGSTCELSLKVPGSDPMEMVASVTSPSGVTELCDIMDSREDHYTIKFVPKEMGVHTVCVKHKGLHIPGSPFQFTVGPITEGGAHKVHANGPGLERGEVDCVNEFNIYTREAGAGGLSISVEGPSKADIRFEDKKDGSCVVGYTVTEPGEYVVSIKFNDEHIPDSPLRVPVFPSSGDARKVSVQSLKQQGLEIGKPSSFTCLYNGAKGMLTAKVVAPSGAEDEALVQSLDDTNSHFAVRFIPRENGLHLIHVLLEGSHIRGSPFRAMVGEQEADPGLVTASGKGLHNAICDEVNELTVHTAGAGASTLGVTIDGPSKVKLDAKQVADGYRFTYTPTAPGVYYATIKYGGNNHIAGSPFKINCTGAGIGTGRMESSQCVVETTEISELNSARMLPKLESDGSKCDSKGMGLQKAFVNKMAQFNVDTSSAGQNMLFVGMIGPANAPPVDEIHIKHQQKNVFNVSYSVKMKGKYLLIVRWGDDHIPGSPFNIEVV